MNDIRLRITTTLTSYFTLKTLCLPDAHITLVQIIRIICILVLGCFSSSKILEFNTFVTVCFPLCLFPIVSFIEFEINKLKNKDKIGKR